ncbi:MAG: helix-turn-helix domain-containing protein [Pseudomonadota bacterium]
MAWFRIKTLCEQCGISERTAREWLQNGLRHSKVKGVVLVKSDWLDSWLEQHEVNHRGVDSMVDQVIKEVTA